MKKTLLAALVATLAACGGGGGIDPTKVTFTYPAALAPQPGAESSAATTGTSSLLTAEALKTSGGADAADPEGNSIVSLPEAVANELDGSLGVAKPQVRQALQKALAIGLAAQPAALVDPCVTVNDAGVTYTNCTESLSEYDSTSDEYSVMTVTLNGSLKRTIEAGAVNATWDLRVAVAMKVYSGADTTGSLLGNVRENAHFTGALRIDDTTIVGGSRSDMTVSVSMPGLSDSASVTHLADYDLDYTPGCLTGGTLQVRRVFTNLPTGATSDDFPNLGAYFEFGPACNAVKVAVVRG
jgi:hypothetical protein